jgi:VanZ family protein
MSFTRKKRLAAANILYAGLLLGLGMVPTLPAAGVPDHTAHALAYAAQAGLLFIFLLPSQSRGTAAFLAAAGAIVYGGIIEALQLVQPARSFEVADLVANATGAVLGASIAFFLTGVVKAEFRK